ncbi:ribonuclease III [Candidatus Parcubacteria bacterium]|nr:MAG: ribonuclease III [Candidatus Parcubacteria bacterium]
MLQDLESKIGTAFHNKDLLREALTHRSYLNESKQWPLPHNERLEYLGDAVLELVVSEMLFHQFPSFPEGKLTLLRSALVNYQTLAATAKEVGIPSYVLMSKGEMKEKGKAHDTIFADALEAVIGAIYLDQGFEAARSFIAKFIMPKTRLILENKSYKDPKSELQEKTQAQLKVTPTYHVLQESGPAHRRTFHVGVYLDREMIGDGWGNSKQEAETEAARKALQSPVLRQKRRSN